MNTIIYERAIEELKEKLNFQFDEYRNAVENDVVLEERIRLRKRMLMTKTEIDFVAEEMQRVWE